MTSWTPIRMAALACVLLLSSCAHMMTDSKDEERAKLYLQQAADEYNQKEYAKSVNSTETALKYDPNMAAGYNHLALIYMETRQYQKAEQAFNKALDLKPQYPEVFNNFGVLLNREEKYQEAIGYFKKAIADEHYLTPENAYTNLGYAYYRIGDMGAAKTNHQRALDISPQFCLASKNMGDVYAREKNFTKAAEYFERAVTNCPLYQESRYKLGLVLMKMGRKDVARLQLEQLVTKHKNGPYVERSNEVLKYLH